MHAVREGLDMLLQSTTTVVKRVITRDKAFPDPFGASKASRQIVIVEMKIVFEEIGGKCV
jgi:hypothetical protein